MTGTLRMKVSLVKKCKCCSRSFDNVAWLALPLLDLRDEGDGLWLEMRNCPCGATLGLEIQAQMGAAIELEERSVKVPKATL